MNEHQEVKEWYAIANYFKSFNKVNGVAQVPTYYEQTHGRKIVEHDANIWAILKNPNGIILTVYAVLLTLIGLLALLVKFMVRRRKRIKRS